MQNHNLFIYHVRVVEGAYATLQHGNVTKALFPLWLCPVLAKWHQQGCSKSYLSGRHLQSFPEHNSYELCAQKHHAFLQTE